MEAHTEESTIDTHLQRQRSPRRPKTRHARRLALAAVILLLAAVCSWIPGVIGTAGAAILPWLGLGLLALLVATLLLARRVLVLTLVPVLVWLLAMAPTLPGFPAATAEGATPITVASQNVRAQSGGAAASAAELAGDGADVIALTELDGASLAAARDALAAEYPHSYAVGTVALWSRFPISDAEPLFLGLGWKRALRVEVQTPTAPLAVYVLHAASVRPGHQQDRDTMLTGLADAVAADTADALIAVGDFNATSADPALAAIRAQADWVRPTDGTLGFTWPTAFPLARIDQVFVRGLSVLTSTTTRAGNSDHLATMTSITP
ncbi:endonuclease/exonuclease/phosphatase family protein [Microbacterium sp.]|uniref:endonuclease/exonuclease/phosphatase family protein n=1 Tax=Microbacterium sp. TaxID=51671 RepID=UPI002FE09AC1